MADDKLKSCNGCCYRPCRHCCRMRGAKRNYRKKELCYKLCAIMGWSECEAWDIQNMALNYSRLKQIIKR